MGPLAAGVARCRCGPVALLLRIEEPQLDPAGLIGLNTRINDGVRSYRPLAANDLRLTGSEAAPGLPHLKAPLGTCCHSVLPQACKRTAFPASDIL